MTLACVSVVCCIRLFSSEYIESELSTLVLLALFDCAAQQRDDKRRVVILQDSILHAGAVVDTIERAIVACVVETYVLTLEHIDCLIAENHPSPTPTVSVFVLQILPAM
jgi:hypothetical protein